MTILVLANSLPPSGGAEKVAWDLSNIYSLNIRCIFLYLVIGFISFFLPKNSTISIRFVWI